MEQAAALRRDADARGRPPRGPTRGCRGSARPPAPKLRLLLLSCLAAAQLFSASVSAAKRQPGEVNRVSGLADDRQVAIVGATLIDGRGGPPLPDATVVVRGGRIASVGPSHSVAVPAGAERVDGRGLTVMPGLIDAHFHLDGDLELPRLFLARGVTSLRDPGAWIEAYEPVLAQPAALPRLFLTGPHLDSPPPAYPKDARIVRDPEEARLAVERQIGQGASAIKVYFRLPLGLISAVTRAAHRHGVPVTSHLEIVDAGDAIRAGVDGIEHVTSLGTALLPPRDAEAYRQAVLADNEARRAGRYQVWSRIDPTSRRVEELVARMAERGTFLSPTLAVFERREGDRNTTEVHLRAFRNMLAVVGRAHRAGVPIVVGSHSHVPHADRGWAYHREMELLVEAGLTPMEAILAATRENARFFRAEGRLGTVERGKAADLLLLQGDPLRDLGALRRVRGVMLAGAWVRNGAAVPVGPLRPPSRPGPARPN